MSSSLIKRVTKPHDRIAEVVAPFRGSELSQAKIKTAYAVAFPDHEDDLQWIQASDHSRNKTNAGACDCSGTAEAIFEYVAYNKYRVL